MGFVSCLEDITDRYYESSPLSDYRSYLGPAPKPKRRNVDEARFLFGDPIDRPRRLVREFWAYYRQQQPLVEISPSRWERHFLNVKKLNSILTPIGRIRDQHPEAWPLVKDVEVRLRAFFQEVQVYGALSRSVFERVHDISRTINARCNSVIGELNRFEREVSGMPSQEYERIEIRGNPAVGRD